MSIQLLMANPNRRTNGGTSRSNGTRNDLSNGISPINTGQGQTNGFQPLGTEALTDYTSQLAHLEEQNRLRRQLAQDDRRHAQSQPQSPVGPQHPRLTQYEPRSAVDNTYGSRAEAEPSSASTTTSGSQSANDTIYQYQQMLLIEQQRRIREMEETRQQQERQRQREQQERRQ
ncbi:hypothetical protein AC578_2018 [Pseudocercospora eumusae]|uniref:Uncharacterized protein n=1 Tax=Pseudocercospora eumusae TaxID=321146 RepID=A0A139HHG7_9PEZI|nr:hypothetical protein AC578_2018 [Pseudocercospora eumusae]